VTVHDTNYITIYSTGTWARERLRLEVSRDCSNSFKASEGRETKNGKNKAHKILEWVRRDFRLTNAKWSLTEKAAVTETGRSTNIQTVCTFISMQ